MMEFNLKSQQKNYENFSGDTNDYVKEQIEILTKQSKQIKIIRLSGNSYSTKFCEQFSQYVKNLENLEIVDYNDCFVGRKKDEIPESLLFLTIHFAAFQIQKIDLSNNAIGKSGSKNLMPFLEQAKYLKVLLISNCGLGIDGATNISNAIANGCPNLEVIAMARNRIEDSGAQQLGFALQKLCNIKQLYIFQNFIREKGIHSVFIGLQASAKNIEFLDIQDNYLKHESVKELCSLIQVSTNLYGLNLSDCNVDQKDNELLLEALQKSQIKLIKFGYNYNELSQEQAKRLCDIIMHEKLQRLDIKGNEFSNKTKQYYLDRLNFFQLKNEILSAFESDDDDEDDECTNKNNEEIQKIGKLFSDLKI